MAKTTPQPDAVVFDFDGVIVNTEPLHFAAYQEILGPLGLAFTWDEYVTHFLGFDDRDAFREAYRKAGRSVGDAELQRLIEAKAGAFQAQVAAHGAAPYPGVVELIRALAGRVPLALCSGALRRDVQPILGKLAVLDRFNAVVTADDVHASKPDPVSYRLALERLAAVFPGRPIRPARSLAIEDTPAGIDAARAAGMRVVALPNTYTQDRLAAATCVVRSLAGVGMEDLAALAGLT